MQHENFVYVSPYNDFDVIAGNGTIGWARHCIVFTSTILNAIVNNLDLKFWSKNQWPTVCWCRSVGEAWSLGLRRTWRQSTTRSRSHILHPVFVLNYMVVFILSLWRHVQVIGCQPVRSKVMYESVKAGKIVFEESKETLSDGTAGGIEENAVSH